MVSVWFRVLVLGILPRGCFNIKELVIGVMTSVCGGIEESFGNSFDKWP